MTDAAAPITIILLAAQRAGVVNPLAERAGVSHKCLAPIRGKALIRHVMETLVTVPNVEAIRVSVEPEVHAELEAVLADYARPDVPVTLVASDVNIVESVAKAAGKSSGPFVITTADNVLVTRDAIVQVGDELRTADAVIGIAREKNVKAAHPEGQRNYYGFSDGGIANCNLYGLAGPKAFKAAEVFREGGQFMSNPGRMIRAFGLLNILLLKAGLLKLHPAMEVLGERLGATIRAVEFEDGALAIDVDNERTYDVCEELLPTRPIKG